ncbi:fibronectin type III domain-containing protein [Nocardioides sp. CN2-186]|uniref:fibronectin type III domain-containing protein n=1 Tax=Nocardioides tweenelious TaxID=3156607 RepID=UPI0032B37A1F
MAGLGGVLVPAPSNAAAPDITPLPAISSDSVVDSYGVGIHLNFLDTPYADADAVAAKLSDLGVRHVRDDLFLNSPRQYAAIRTVADQGIGFDLIMGRPDSGATPADYVRTVADQLPAGAVESIEGVNEWDLFGGDNWVAEMTDWQKQLYAAARASSATSGLPLLAPSLAFRQNYASVPDLSAYSDLANAHMYPGGFLPSNEITRITQALRGMIPTKPLITTEAGYHNALNSDNGHRAVPEDVAGVYLPRLLLEHVRRGEKRVYSYELIDEFTDPGLTNPEANFGLLHHDLTPKPAYTSMQRLLALMADPGPEITPGSLAVAADGFPSDGRYVLTQKRDGSFVLLMWRDVSIYDPTTQQPVAVTPKDVTLRLADPAQLKVYRPSDSGDPVGGTTTGTSLPLKLDGEVTAIAIDPVRPVPPPAPADVRVRRGNGSATVTWDLPQTSAAVTGFEVLRSGGVPQRVPAEARSFTDTGLVNGATYSYTVRTLTDDGSSVAVSSPDVVPATVPTRPGAPTIKAGRARVTVGWRDSLPQGSAVTAYRLVYLGRTVTVGAGANRATIKHLRAGKKIRVGIQARNAVGWGPTAYTRAVRPKG